MRMIMTVGYQHLLLGGKATTEVMSALADSQLIKEEGPYEHKVYVKNEDGNVSFKFVADDDVRLPEIDKSAELKQVLAMHKEKSDAETKMYQETNRANALQRKVEELEKKLATIVGAVNPAAKEVSGE